MTYTGEHEPGTPSWWRLLRRDPVLLAACLTLAVVAGVVVVLTAVDRTAARAAAVPVAVDPLPASTGDPVPVPPAVSGSAPAGSSSSVPPAATLPERPTVSGTAAPTPSDNQPVPCPTSGVVVRASDVDAAMGLRAMGMELVNCGTRPYRVKGYPAVRLLGPDRTPLSVDIIEGRSAITILPSVDDPPAMVVLRPGEQAYAVLVWRSTMIPGPEDRATFIEVTARAGDQPETVDPVSQLDIGTGGRLGVGPWTHRPT